MKASCLECGGAVSVPDNVLQGEIVSCPDCGAEFEVKSGSGVATLVPAPKIEEDWGE